MWWPFKENLNGIHEGIKFTGNKSEQRVPNPQAKKDTKFKASIAKPKAKTNSE